MPTFVAKFGDWEAAAAAAAAAAIDPPLGQSEPHRSHPSLHPTSCPTRSGAASPLYAHAETGAAARSGQEGVAEGPGPCAEGIGLDVLGKAAASMGHGAVCPRCGRGCVQSESDEARTGEVAAWKLQDNLAGPRGRPPDSRLHSPAGPTESPVNPEAAEAASAAPCGGSPLPPPLSESMAADLQRLAQELEAARGEVAERAGFLAVLGRARRAAGGRSEAVALGSDCDSERGGGEATRPLCPSKKLAAAEDKNPSAGGCRACPRGIADELLVEYGEALRDAVLLLGELEREGVWLLLRTDALAASLSDAEAERARSAAALAERERALQRARECLALEQGVNEQLRSG